MKPKRVLIADHRALLRYALRGLVGSSADMIVAGEATDGVQAVTLAMRLLPDAMIINPHMPDLSAVDALNVMRSTLPGVRVIALDRPMSDLDDASTSRSNSGGASGCQVAACSCSLLHSEPEALLEAIRLVLARPADPSSRREHILGMPRRAGATRAILPRDPRQLTERELSIVQLIARGKSNAEIAAALCLSVTTIKANVGRIMCKWGMRNRVQVLIYAIADNIVPVDQLELSVTTSGWSAQSGRGVGSAGKRSSTGS